MTRSASPIEQLHGGSPPAPRRDDATAGLLAVRRPIHDARLRLVAHELILFERGGDGVPRAAPDLATPRAIDAVVAGLGAQHPVHVRLAPAVLLGPGVTALPPDRIVPVVSAAAGHDEAVVEALLRLAHLGYAVAADGVRATPATAPLLAACGAVRLSVGEYTPPELAQQVTRMRVVTKARLVAVGVADHATLERCRKLGFSQFEGAFFLEPTAGSLGGGERVNTGAHLQLLAALQRDPDLEELQEIVARDIGLSYRLLRFVNSAFFALPRKVESVHQAAVLLGTSNIERWASLSVLATSGEGKPSELVATGLARAHMCELLAPAYPEADPASFFTVGLFSVIDALMGLPMADVLETLPFSEDVESAIARFEGDRGHALRSVIAWERGELAEIDPPPGLTLEALGATYRESLAWATNLAGGLR